MNREAIIVDSMIYPMIEGVPSILQVTVEFNDGSKSTIDTKGSLHALQTKFGFRIDGDNYNLSNMINKKCVVEKDGSYKYIFRGFLD